MDDNENPFQLIKKMRDIIQNHLQTIRDYQETCTIYQMEKNTIINQINQKNKIIDEMAKRIHIQQQQNLQKDHAIQQIKQKLKAAQEKGNLLKKRHISTNQNYLYKSVVPQTKAIESNGKMFQSQKRIKQELEPQFVPQNIKFHKKNQQLPPQFPSLMNQTFYNNGPLPPGQSLIEDFYIIGPDDAQFRKIRDNHRNKDFIQVKSDIKYNINKFYKSKKPQFLQEIAKRAFPDGVKMKKKTIESSIQINNIIEFRPQKKISQDFFVFTLKGDDEVFRRTSCLLTNVNPNNLLFLICLKIPDFICIRDEKHYQRKDYQVWVIQKIYAFSSYYPFINIFISALQKIQSIIYSNRISKIMYENQSFSIYQFSRNIFDLQKSQIIKEILTYLVNRKPDYGQVCYNSGHYFGVMPQYGYYSYYSLSRSTCSIFFSTFSYEEALLLLYSIFCQKTLVFLSKYETKATLCGLFLVSLIWPFQFPNSQLLLNCDSQKMTKYIFECPFSMIASIKKTQDNIDEILGAFAESNILRWKGHEYSSQCILIDVDSNTILYDSILLNMFDEVVFSPSPKLQSTYLSVNSCHSKSFSLPQKMKIQNKKWQKPRCELQKNQQQKRKAVQQYKKKLQNHKQKIPIYQLTDEYENLLKCFIEFISTLTIDKNDLNDFIQQSKQNRKQYVRNYLLEKYKDKVTFIDNLINSQIYANYMDSLYNK